MKTIDSSAETIWKTLIDVENWPNITPSITSITPLDGSPIATGNRYRVVQPKLRPTTYVVTHLEPCRNFTWEASSFGYKIMAEHLIRESATTCELVIRLSFHGLLAPIIGLIAGATTKEYIELESEGFKKSVNRSQLNAK